MVLSLTDGLLPQAAAFAPPFIAFYYASKSNLLAYYRLQHGIPTTFHQDDPTKTKHRRRIVILTAIGLLGLVSILNFTQRSTPIASIETAIALVFSPVAFLGTEMAIGEALGLYQQRLLRKQLDGSLIVQFGLNPEASHFWYRIAASNIFTSLCIVGAFAYHETICICILYACSLYFFLSTKLPGKEADGMRTILLGSMFISLVLLALLGLVFLFIRFVPEADSHKDKDSAELDSLMVRMFADAQWYAPASVVSLLIHIISIALRFDYSNFVSRQSGDQSTPYIRLDKHEPGYRLRNAEDDKGFKTYPKTYFSSALFMLFWTAFTLHVALLFVPADLIDGKHLEGVDYGGYSLEPEWARKLKPNSMMLFMLALIPTAMMCVPASLYLVALCRGEVKTLWAYKEDWTKAMSVTDAEKTSDQFLDEEAVSGESPSQGSLPSSSPGKSLTQKQMNLLSMQRAIFGRSNGEYGLDSTGMLRAFARGQVAKGALAMNNSNTDDSEVELIEDDPYHNVLVLAFDLVLLIVDESHGPLEDNKYAPILTKLSVGSISSLKACSTAEGVHSLVISTFYTDDVPSELEIIFGKQSTMHELKEVITNLIQNAQIIEILRTRLSDGCYYKPGYQGDKSASAKAKGKTNTDDLGYLRCHAKALVRRGSETKVFYVYLFSEALVCIRSVSDSEGTASSRWTRQVASVLRSTKSKLTQVPGWKAAASRLSIRDDLDEVAGAVPPGDSPLVLQGRIFVQHMEGAEPLQHDQGSSGTAVDNSEAELEYPHGVKFGMKRTLLGTSALDPPFELFFTDKRERAKWLEESTFLIKMRELH